MQELLQEINARLSKIEKALGIRTPVTSCASDWVLCDSHTQGPIDPLTWTPHPWPAGPIAPGPGYPEPEEIDAGMAAIEDQEAPESETPEEPELATPTTNRVAKKPKDYGIPGGDFYPGDRVTNGHKNGEVKDVGATHLKVLWDGGLRAKWLSANEISLISTKELPVAKTKSQAAAIVQGFKIRHHEPKVRAVLVSEPGTRVTNGTKTGTIKETGDRGIKVLWDGGLRAKWLSATQLTVI